MQGATVGGVASDLAVLFPGQGSHADADRSVAGAALPALLERCDALTGVDVFARAEDSTAYAQPAIFLASLAAWTQTGLATEDVAVLAGHSLGELTALTAAGALEADAALVLVVERGRLMAAADQGGMLALRAEPEQAAALAAASDTVVANDNCPGQVVLSGSDAALDRAEALLGEHDLRGKRLPVAGAFHSPLMQEAAEAFAAVLRGTAFRPPRTTVLCCATAAPFTDPQVELARALTAPVRFRELLQALPAHGVTRVLDAGPGRVIAGLVRRTDRSSTLVEVPDVVLA